MSDRSARIAIGDGAAGTEKYTKAHATLLRMREVTRYDSAPEMMTRDIPVVAVQAGRDATSEEIHRITHDVHSYARALHLLTPRPATALRAIAHAGEMNLLQAVSVYGSSDCGAEPIVELMKALCLAAPHTIALRIEVPDGAAGQTAIARACCHLAVNPRHLRNLQWLHFMVASTRNTSLTSIESHWNAGFTPLHDAGVWGTILRCGRDKLHIVRVPNSLRQPAVRPAAHWHRVQKQDCTEYTNTAR